LEDSRFVYCAYFQFHQFGNKVRASRVKASPTNCAPNKNENACGGLLRPGAFSKLDIENFADVVLNPKFVGPALPIRMLLNESIEPPIRRLFGPKNLSLCASDYGRGNGFTAPSVSQAFWFRERLCEFWVLHLPLPFSAQADRRWFSRGQHVLFHWCSDRLAAHRSVYLPISS
jgi:hypothetical protein